MSLSARRKLRAFIHIRLHLTSLLHISCIGDVNASHVVISSHNALCFFMWSGASYITARTKKPCLHRHSAGICSPRDCRSGLLLPNGSLHIDSLLHSVAYLGYYDGMARAGAMGATLLGVQKLLAKNLKLSLAFSSTSLLRPIQPLTEKLHDTTQCPYVTY